MELPTWAWIFLALLLGVVSGSISWGLKKKARAHLDLLDEIRAGADGDARVAGQYRDDYDTTESVMDRAILEDRFPIDSMEN